MAVEDFAIFYHRSEGDASQSVRNQGEDVEVLTNLTLSA